jgi:hypothetical protein
LKAELRRLRATRNDSVENIPELMIMQEMPVRRKAYVLDRGQYDTYKKRFSGCAKGYSPYARKISTKQVGFAQWLVHPDHPLTARVAVNRYWQMYFGRGLVKTAEDFGNQGEMPSNPELLDWLAVYLLNQDGILKPFKK